MTPDQCLDLIRTLVGELHGPAPDDAPLGLDSLTVVMLVEAIEDACDLSIEAKDVVPEHFDSISALAGFVHRKLA